MFITDADIQYSTVKQVIIVFKVPTPTGGITTHNLLLGGALLCPLYEKIGCGEKNGMTHVLRFISMVTGKKSEAALLIFMIETQNWCKMKICIITFYKCWCLVGGGGFSLCK